MSAPVDLPTKRWRYRQALGLPSPMVLAAPAYDHVEQLLAWGVPVVSIAEAAGTTHQTISDLRRGRFGRLRRELAAAILAVGPHPHPAQRRVLAIGARRRYQALMTLGYPAPWQAPRIGYGHRPHHLGTLLARTTIPAHYHWAIVELFREVVASGKRGPSEHAARLAIRHGYAGPLDWGDIDDPAEVPDSSGLQKRQRQRWSQAHRKRRAS